MGPLLKKIMKLEKFLTTCIYDQKYIEYDVILNMYFYIIWLYSWPYAAFILCLLSGTGLPGVGIDVKDRVPTPGIGKVPRIGPRIGPGGAVRRETRKQKTVK